MERTKKDLARVLSRVRTDVCAKHINGRAAWTNKPLSERVLKEHLEGKTACGVAFMSPDDDKTSVAVIDLDDHSGELGIDAVILKAAQIRARCLNLGLEPEGFVSRGGKGVHLWFVWENPQQASGVRHKLQSILNKEGLTAKTRKEGLAGGFAEIFPKQDRLAKGRFGNFVWLPFTGKSTPINFDLLEPDPEAPVIWPFSKEVPTRPESLDQVELSSIKTDLKILNSLLDKIPDGLSLGYEDWITLGMIIHYETEGSEEGFNLWLHHSSRWAEYEGADDLRPHWDSFRLNDTNLVTFDSLYRVLDNHGLDDVLSEFEESLPGEFKYKKLINPAELNGVEPPLRQWIVPSWIPAKAVTGLYGDGGIGKSLLAMQLMTSVATGTPFCGMDVAQCRTLGVFCEDDAEELHRRQLQICESLFIDMEDLGDIRWAPRVGCDNLLMTFKDGKGTVTKFWRAIRDSAVKIGAKLIVLDTAADLFGGNENDRQQVRQFVQGACGRLALDTGAAVILLAHPSRTGLSSRTGESGSTAWNAAFRSRLYFARDEGGPDHIADADRRILQKKKANYASMGDAINLIYKDGVFLVDDGTTEAQTLEQAKDKFIEIMIEVIDQGRPLSANLRSPAYAPKIMEGHPANDAPFDVETFRVAMEQLLHAGEIEIGHIKTRDRKQVASLVRVFD